MPAEKFLCDRMILNLGRWLRAAGHDAAFVGKSESDAEILKHSLAEKRWLLTRDSEFLEMKQARDVLIFCGQEPLEICVELLNKLLMIDWLYHPFSRCLICNSLLIKPKIEIVTEKVPKEICLRIENFWYCEHCHKVFWDGSHTKRMLEQLKKWSRM